MTVESLLNEARKLSRDEQTELLDELICLVEPEEPDALSLTPAQRADLDKRLEELRSGRAKLIPGDEVVERLRRKG